MDVSVCIVNWNTCDLLRRCLLAIRQRTHGIEIETIVVDNLSGDGSAQMVSREFPEVTLIASAQNLGFSRGCNLAAAAASGDFILYLNPDTELASNAIHGMWMFLKSSALHGAVGCRLLNSDGSIQFTCACSFPTPRNELTSLLFLDRLFPSSRLFSSREMGFWDHADSRDVECLSGACMMLRQPLAQRLSGFDERLFMYGEDLDLCRRIRMQGLRLRYLATESIFHHEGASSKKKGRSFAPLLQRVANHYFLRKHFGRWAALAYRAAVSVGSATRVVGAVLLWPAWLCRRGASARDLSSFILRQTDLLLWSIGVKAAPSR